MLALHLSLCPAVQARCALDVCDASRVSLERCSVHDTSASSIRLYSRARLELERCHVAHSMTGIVVQDRSSLALRMSRVESIWCGAAVAAIGAASVDISRCDLRQCSTGILLHDAARVNMSYSAVINCTFSAFHQVEREEEDAIVGAAAAASGRGGRNACRLALRGNSVYSSLSGMTWWDRNRPSVLEQDKNLFEDAEPAVTGGRLPVTVCAIG